MPSLFRRKLSCFYCGHQVSVQALRGVDQYPNGRLRRFNCPDCSADNHLDEVRTAPPLRLVFVVSGCPLSPLSYLDIPLPPPLSLTDHSLTTHPLPPPPTGRRHPRLHPRHALPARPRLCPPSPVPTRHPRPHKAHHPEPHRRPRRLPPRLPHLLPHLSPQPADRHQRHRHLRPPAREPS